MDKRLLSHAYKLTCSLCQQTCHLKCLPRVSRNDSIYQDKACSIWYCPPCSQSIFPFNHYDEDDLFYDALNELRTVRPTVPLEVINNQHTVFNPFDINEDADLQIHDIDPDLNFYNSHQNTILQCDYYIEDSFNQKVSNLKNF